MAAPAQSPCSALRVPWPDAADQGDPQKMAENWKALERWAGNLVKYCLCEDCGGGGG